MFSVLSITLSKSSVFSSYLEYMQFYGREVLCAQRDPLYYVSGFQKLLKVEYKNI
jgi:hypothetical protein